MNKQTLLVRTPAQLPHESPAGFVLRLSEVNGYETPQHVFALAGIARDEAFTRRLNVQQISQVLGCAESAMHGYELTNRTGEFGTQLCGQRIHEGDLGLSSLGVCPECIQERGYIPAWSDLKMVDACPVHMRTLVSVCSACGFKLHWHRPGLLACRCGADLSRARGIPISSEHGALLGQLASKIEGSPVDTMFGMLGILLNPMPVGRVIQMARCLSLLHRAAFDQKQASQAQRAARLFADWPNNFYSALHALVPLEANASGASLMRKHAEGLYRTWHRTLTAAPDVAFLRETIAGYAQQRTFKDAAELVVPSEFIESPPEHKRRHPEKVPSGTRRRSLPEPGERSVSTRAAAKAVGLPVAALRYLRQSGHFEVHYKATRAQTFHEADIASFLRKVSGLEVSRAPTGRSTTSLKKLLAQKYKFADGKGELVAAILDGVLPVVSKSGPAIGDMRLDATHAGAFIADARERAFAGALSGAAVAAELKCVPMVIAGLIEGGYLRGHHCAAGLRISSVSVQEYQSRYRSLASIAKESGISSRRLLKQAQIASIKLLTLARATVNSSQSFVRVQDIEALLAVPHEARAAAALRRRVETSARRALSHTRKEAAVALQCTVSVVTRLLALGYLSTPGSKSAGVTSSSVVEFLQHYRSVVEVSKEHGVGPTRIINEAHALGITLLTIPRRIDASPQYFMSVADAQKLRGPYESKRTARLRTRRPQKVDSARSVELAR